MSPVVLAPRSWLGVLGGGQLGRMFAMAAQSLGYRVCVLDPAADSPAGNIADRHIQAAYDDPAALAELGRSCQAVTTEFENVPAAALARLAEQTRVTPAAAAVAIAQDRSTEKAFIASCGVPVAPYRAVAHREQLEAADPALFPAILKVARLGYDGKGQARVADLNEALAAFDRFAAEAGGPVPCVLEQRLTLALEVSVVVARDLAGNTVTFPVTENRHVDGILAQTTVPARVDPAIADQARAAATTIASRLDYHGVLCVEFFVLADGRLVANEMAPRPHNSGHWSIEGALTSQFEQQARVMAGLPLGETAAIAPAVMINILGDAWFPTGAGAPEAKTGTEAGTEAGTVAEAGREPDWAAVLATPGTRLHLYGKAEPRRGRKMGHLTVLAGDRDEALARAARGAPLLAQTGFGTP